MRYTLLANDPATGARRGRIDVERRDRYLEAEAARGRRFARADFPLHAADDHVVMTETRERSIAWMCGSMRIAWSTSQPAGAS